MEMIHIITYSLTIYITTGLYFFGQIHIVSELSKRKIVSYYSWVFGIV